MSLRIGRLVLLCWAATCGMPSPADDIRHVAVIAGAKTASSGPGGIDDYAWSARLLKTMLEKSNITDRLRVTVHFNGWPHGVAALRDADTIVILADGFDGETGAAAPHLATPERVALVDSLMKEGRGIVVLHRATCALPSVAEQALDWYGGHFDGRTTGGKDARSAIATMEATVTPVSPRHPVTEGVEPFNIRNEFLHDIRFRDNDPRWTPIWRVESLPSKTPRGKTVAWVVEREGGGRGFAASCGNADDAWRNDGFRTTLLNAVAWTAHVPIPEGGVQAAFFSRDDVARHLGEADLIAPPSVAEDDVYADKPYWFKPGHPLNPADAAEIKTLPGFEAERILTVPVEFGSWTALTVDSRGRLLAAAQHEPGIYRITVPAIGDVAAETKVEPLQGVASKIGWSHGLLYAFDSLYVTVSEKNDDYETGIYRLRDTDGDDQFDNVRLILRLDGDGEHGPHNMVAGPDAASLYLMGGNGTRLPENLERRRPASTEGLDHLFPPGFESSKYAPSGWVLRMDPAGSHRELVTSGLRNSFDLAFNRHGDLFTFDSDMEWDLGAPWYRPTRICQLVSGGEFGWREEGAVWPEYFEDNLPPVVNIGPASPTGVAFGYGTRFPARYQQALFACDWTFATIHAVHLERTGAGYRANVEEFLGGRGLPVTDIAVGHDGALYFTVGGRRLGSAIYRVHYSGKDSTAEEPTTENNPAADELHALRRRLEEFHGRRDPQALATAWPRLSHPDRRIRFAARVAIESQDVEEWIGRALREDDPSIRLQALLALARQAPAERQADVLARLNQIDLAGLTSADRLQALRVYELALARGDAAVRGSWAAVRAKIRPLFPDDDPFVSRELSRLLCLTGEASIIDPALKLMREDTGGRPVLGSGYWVRNPKYGEAVRDMLEAAPLAERMHHAQMLLWIQDGWRPEQREEYFRLIAQAKQSSRGGHWYAEFWDRIREAALKSSPEDQRERYESIGAGASPALTIDGLPKPQGPGREWKLEEALEVVESGLANRNFTNGEKMFAAASCIACHRFNGQGSSVGPDLSTLGQRFTLRDILDATLNPSKAVSDQYRVTMVVTTAGQTLSGRLVSRDEQSLRLATNLMRPTAASEIALADVDAIQTVPVSTMPTRLLNALSEDELLDLLAYLTSGGDRRHPVFGSAGAE